MKGEVVYLYAFDVANEIKTEKVREILKTVPEPLEIRTDHTFPKDITLYKPLSIKAAPLKAVMNGKQVSTFINVYDVGVVSVVMRAEFEVEHLDKLLPFHKPMLEDGRSLDQVARELCAETCKSIRRAMVQSSHIPEPEAYTVFCLTDMGRAHNLEHWAAENRDAIASLLTENQPDTLSANQVAEINRLHVSYSKTDLTVIDWDAALVVDLAGYVDDTLYILELANLQLEEYHVMDQRLDSYLDKAYEDLHKPRYGLFRTYTRELSELRFLQMDVTKLRDDVTNITKLFGDWYLARVYLAARERFHIAQWRDSVEDRLKQLDALYSVAHTEIANTRMLWLEILIVVFFAIDLVGIFFFR